MPDEKMRRNKELLLLQDRMSLEINTRIIGQKVDVLAEGASLRNASTWAGRTRTNKIVIFEPDPAVRRGNMVITRIERVMAQTLYGKLA